MDIRYGLCEGEVINLGKWAVVYKISQYKSYSRRRTGLNRKSNVFVIFVYSEGSFSFVGYHSG